MKIKKTLKQGKSFLILCLVFYSGNIVAQNKLDTIKTYQLNEVVVKNIRTDNRTYLQRLVVQKIRKVKDTSCAFILRYEDSILGTSDTLPLILVVCFTNGAINNAQIIYSEIKDQMFNKYPNPTCNISIYEIFNRLVILKKSLALLQLQNGKGYVNYKPHETFIEFQEYGSEKLNYSIIAIYKFFHIGIINLTSCYNGQNINSSHELNFQLNAKDLYPDNISVINPANSQHLLSLKRITIPLNLDKAINIKTTKSINSVLLQK